MKALKVFCFIALGGLLLLVEQGARAQNYKADQEDAAHVADVLEFKLPKRNEKISINNEFYTRGQIEQDFFKIAISNHLWLDDAENFEGVVLQYEGDYEGDKRMHPIVAEYLHRQGGYPKLQAINKWTNEITIGIGWQRVNIRQGNNGPLKEIEALGFNPWGQQHPEVYSLFKEQIISLVPDIQKITGLPVRFVENDDPREIANATNPEDGSSNHARIRVVPTRLTGSRTLIPGHGPHTIEPYFLGGVAFTPFEIGQVDGYLLPNADNTIGFAACRINPDLKESLVRALITECLVRVLGLPELSKFKNNSALSHWNKNAGEYTQDFIDQRRKEDEKLLKKGEDARMAFRKKASKYQYPESMIETHDLEKGFSGYDRFMISLLYCQSIMPGMVIYDVSRLMQSNDNCWNNAKKNIGE